MKSTYQNPVILIGGNHYNGLALVRMFARHGIDVYGIIIGKNVENGFLGRSKYWKEVRYIEENEQIISCLDSFACDVKPVLIAWSDGAASELDRHYDELKERFILPSVNKEQGLLYSYMDKEKQKDFAEACSLPTAETIVISLTAETNLSALPYPCICKPLISAEGNKKDIRKLEDRDTLEKYLEEKKADGYEKILLQEYLDIDIEYDIQGYVDRGEAAYLVTRKIRTWPNIGGPTSYSYTVDDMRLEEVAGKIISQLERMNYSGLFDADIFCVGGKLYFNEINWRNSALGYIAANSKLYYQILWYDAVTGQSHPGLKRKPDVYGLYSMNEFADIYHVLKKEMPLSEWLRQYRGCTGFAYRDPEDPEPAKAKLKDAVKNRLMRKKADQESA